MLLLFCFLQLAKWSSVDFKYLSIIILFQRHINGLKTDLFISVMKRLFLLLLFFTGYNVSTENFNCLVHATLWKHLTTEPEALLLNYE